MNKRANITLNAVCEQYDPEHLQNILYLGVLGSQVRNTERPDSNLDFFYVFDDAIPPTLSFSKVIEKIILSEPFGMRKISLYRSTLKMFEKECDVYGTVSHRAIYEGMPIFARPKINKYLDLLELKPLKEASQYWIDEAKKVANSEIVTRLSKEKNKSENDKEKYTIQYNPKTDRDERTDVENRGICVHMHRAIRHCLFALMLYDEFEFPYYRTVDKIPAKYYHGVLDGFDIERIACWQYDFWWVNAVYTADDAQYGVRAANTVYERTVKILQA